jgi:hypothetical protein
MISDVSGATGALITEEHNSFIGSATAGWGTWIGHPPALYTTTANQINSYRSNLHWTNGANPDALPIQNFVIGTAGTPSLSPANTVNVAQVDYNGVFGGAVAATFGAGVNANCNPSTSLGTHYDICTASGTPGTHDVTSDPKLIDVTRNAFQWASRVKGHSFTIAGLLAAMMQCQDAGYCIRELETWVKTGMQPTSMAYKGAAHDGTDIGAVQMTSFGRAE